MIKGSVENICAYFRSAKALLSIRNTFERSGEMSNAQRFLPVFSCSRFIRTGERHWILLRNTDFGGKVIVISKSHNSRFVLWLGASCLTALFGIQQQPGSLASSLSVGPQHLFPLLCRNFLYLARSWTLSIGVQVNVCSSVKRDKVHAQALFFSVPSATQLLKGQY